MNISQIIARQILDSRGVPTVEVDVVLSNGGFGRAAVPSGASTGSGEALELRDGGAAYGGNGVSKAIANVREIITPALIGKHATDQRGIDELMIQLDGTENKSKLGANAILAVSLAVAKAAADAKKMPVYAYVGRMIDNTDYVLPMPLMNVINGGKHAAGSTDIQEFMIVPVGGKTFDARMKIGAEVFMALKAELKDRKLGTTVGDEGGFAPALGSNEEALKLLCVAVERAGYKLGTDVAFALDCAASELYKDGVYDLKIEGRKLSSQEMTHWYEELVSRYPIISIEDGLAEDDWDGWRYLCKVLGDKIQIVGDDLTVTNVKLISKAIELKAANTLLVKPNQIGTLSETIDSVQMAHKAGWKAIISHRSGETEDTTIAHLVVGLKCAQIKSGSLSRSERLAKYNELLRIEEQLV